MNMKRFLKIAGDYTEWTVYRKAVIICDVTELFINNALPKNSRTVDQMRQAARSCKQNIVEGAGDATISMEMGIKLIGVARGSARELYEDYGDYLRQHDMAIWPLDHRFTIRTRNFCRNTSDPQKFMAAIKECKSYGTVANIMLTQLKQMDTLLAMTLKDMEEEFIKQGGIKEAMTRSRLDHRNNRNTPPGGDSGTPG